MRAAHLSALLAVLALCAAPAAGQQGPLFPRLFPQPTGRNGYEELVRAVDLARGCAEWSAYEGLPAEKQTLAAKRRVLSALPVQAALASLRAGLAKPVRQPRATVDFSTGFPELAGFRSLARLLGVELYVLYADGRVGQAIDCLRDALRFGYAIQMDSLISGLVAIAIDALVLRQAGDHLDQLSARDCDRMLALARDWLNTSDPAIPVVASERDRVLAFLANCRADPNLLRGVEDQVDQWVSEHPAEVGPMLDRAAAVVRARYDQFLALLRTPVWQRKPLRFAADDPVAGPLVSTLLPDSVLQQVANKYAFEMAQVQILGVNAAIRRYRWEHNRLPETLAELNLGAVAVDPFTGQSLSYRRVDSRAYTLSSVGPEDPESPGVRQPITLPYAPR